MSDLRYRLVVLTHGAHDTLTDTLQAFADHVTPEPYEIVVHSDGRIGAARAYALAATFGPDFCRRWVLSQDDVQEGFCGATRQAWLEGAAPGVDYVFYLEHDFIVTRHVDLGPLAAELDDDHRLAQMSLMRNPVSADEQRAGGLYESRKDAFTPRGLLGQELIGMAPTEWLEHRIYVTTNPCLMRQQFMAGNPWPAYTDQCEGRFGIDLLGRGYHFGVWGDGQPWVQHVGLRDGHSY